MVSRILVLVILIVVCSSIGIISLKRLEQKEVANTQQLRTTLLRQLSRTDHLRLFVAALGVTADLSAHSHSQLVVPSHCLCTYTDDAFAVRPYCPTNWYPCFVVARKSRCTYLTSILTYHMLRVEKSFSFYTIGWTNDPYRPRRKCWYYYIFRRPLEMILPYYQCQ